ncbi:MAG: hypothetical protein KQJ78_10120 [Deltaproteobacteria bacterium]|nr:hypothetical protein [Deltaproteobacteria bacterium]
MAERDYGYRDYHPEPVGDVFTDRLNPEWPRMKGYEITEEEFREEEAKILAEGRGCVTQ